MVEKPTGTPRMWGTVARKPKFAAVAVAIATFGPGVNDPTSENSTKAQSCPDSMPSTVLLLFDTLRVQFDHAERTSDRASPVAVERGAPRRRHRGVVAGPHRRSPRAAGHPLAVDPPLRRGPARVPPHRGRGLRAPRRPGLHRRTPRLRLLRPAARRPGVADGAEGRSLAPAHRRRLAPPQHVPRPAARADAGRRPPPAGLAG